MKPNRILLALMAAFLLCSCDSSEIRQGRKAYQAYFKKYLKDPESFKVYKEEYKETDKGIEWTLDYGAKNSYGAMNRETVHFSTIGNSVITDDGIYDKSDLE